MEYFLIKGNWWSIHPLVEHTPTAGAHTHWWSTHPQLRRQPSIRPRISDYLHFVIPESGIMKKKRDQFHTQSPFIQHSLNIHWTRWDTRSPRRSSRIPSTQQRGKSDTPKGNESLAQQHLRLQTSHLILETSWNIKLKKLHRWFHVRFKRKKNS